MEASSQHGDLARQSVITGRVVEMAGVIEPAEGGGFVVHGKGFSCQVPDMGTAFEVLYDEPDFEIGD